MTHFVDSSTLHRSAKYFMDNGQVATHAEAMALLKQFGLNIYTGPELAASLNHQNALLSLVNMAARTFLGGIYVLDLPDAPSLSPLAPNRSLKEAVLQLGGTIVDTAAPAWPSALLGSITAPASSKPCWRVTWSRWRGGVTPAREEKRLDESIAIALAPLLAAAACTAEAFAFHAGNCAMAGRRDQGLSLWSPGRDWLTADATEPALTALPSKLWIIGLGNLGQAFAWTLASLPYRDKSLVTLILNDFDVIASSNQSTSLLSEESNVGQKKARVVARWLEECGFVTHLEERRFGEWMRPTPNEPRVALCGVDNALARADLEKPGFGLVVEAGLGAGPEAFRSISMHTFPASRKAEDIWSAQVGQANERVDHMPAYQSLKDAGVDSCGLAQLASRTVGVPFVGQIAACHVFAELLRRLNGGQAYEVISSSATALVDTETVPIAAKPYSFGHLEIEKESYIDHSHSIAQE